MKRLITVLVLILCFAMLFTACDKKSKNPTTEDGETYKYTFLPGDYLSGLHYVEMKVKGYGTMILEIDCDVAPKTGTNFLRLVDAKFYDNLTFHRIIAGFMAQGGDASDIQTREQLNRNVPGEFLLNGYDNTISHTRGTISLARGDDYNSGNSQFFIVQEDSTYLDGQYAGFGHVIDGMDVVDAMCEDADPNAVNGMLATGDQPVISYAKLLGPVNPLEK